MSESGRRGERRRPGTGRVGHGGRARTSDPARRSAARPSERRRSADPARTTAYESLRAVSEGAYANLDLPQRLRRARLEATDAAFVTELVYGVTRMRGLYDAIIERCSGRALADIDPPVLDVLRLGTHQVLGMRVPVHAAVDTTVGLARQVVGAGPASFTNAVLRRISEKSREEWLDLVAPAADPGREEGPFDLDDVARAHSHPVWMVRALRTALLDHGASTPERVDADLVDLLASHNVPAPVTLVARPGLIDTDDLLTDSGGERGELSPYAVRLRDGGDPGRLRAVRDGRAAVQDEGSQLVVLTLLAAYDALGPGRDRGGASDSDTAASSANPEPPAPRWLDLCAGPGGKAGLLAAEAMRRGATLFANEISEHRAELVEAAIGAAVDAGADVFVGVGDGRTVGAQEPGSFDLVLLDAPCTGLGALRRRPDARWRRVPGDVADLTQLQESLLASALDATAPRGLVGYVTCSPHVAETRHVVSRVLRDRTDVEVVDVREHLDASVASRLAGSDSAFLQTWTHRDETDGMFLAVLRVSERRSPVC